MTMFFSGASLSGTSTTTRSRKLLCGSV